MGSWPIIVERKSGNIPHTISLDFVLFWHLVKSLDKEFLWFGIFVCELLPDKHGTWTVTASQIPASLGNVACGDSD